MDPESGRIESWKAIADYIHCDVTTAMRWEKERRLPIYRHQGDKRSGVYTFRMELDAWLERGRKRGPADEVRNQEQTTGGLEPLTSDTPDGQGTVRASLLPAPTGVPVVRRRLAIAGVTVVGLLSLLGVATNWSHGRDHPISLRIEGATLEALNATGRPIWTHVFGAPFPSNPTAGQELGNRSWIGDLDGNGRSEVLFLSTQPVGDGAFEDTLYCFDSGGSELWSFRLKDTFRFKTGDFSPPWFSGLLAVYDVRGEKRIAMSLAHGISWPAPLLTFNSRGERLTTFVSSGLIYQLRTTTREGRPLIIAGGVSNSREAASLIVLDGEKPVGTAPEEAGSPYECLSCPAGQPLRYFSFPKTELAIAAKRPYNQTTRVQALGSDLLVGVLEVKDVGEGHENSAMTLFRFDSTFHLTDARWSDSFAPVHKIYEETGDSTTLRPLAPTAFPELALTNQAVVWSIWRSRAQDSEDVT